MNDILVANLEQQIEHPSDTGVRASENETVACFCSLSPLAAWLGEWVWLWLWGEGRGEGFRTSGMAPSPQPSPPQYAQDESHIARGGEGAELWLPTFPMHT